MCCIWHIDCGTVQGQPYFVSFKIFWPVVILTTFWSWLECGIWYNTLWPTDQDFLFGIHDIALVFFGSYLSGTKQFLFWVVNWIYLLCCMTLLMVLTQSSSFHPAQQPLSNVIVQHSFLHSMHHMFANDTELYNLTHCFITDSLVCNIQNCVSNVKKKKKKGGPPTTGWMKLNENKTETLLFDLFKSSDLPDVLKIGQLDIPFCNSP